MSSLELRSVNRSFGAVQALKDLSLTVNEGEIYGFVGSNGAGKTTAMRIILGVLAADSGRVTFGGRPLDLAMRTRVGYMPEERGLYPKMKVGSQLSYLAQLHGMTSQQASKAADHWTEVLGVADRRNDDVQKLSLGNQQRVQLAAALVHNPALLVLDEPFSGLDPIAVDVMSTVLRQQADAGVPIIFSSHQLDLVERISDRVGIIQAGTMVAEGSTEELRTTENSRFKIRVEEVDDHSWVTRIPQVRVLDEGGDVLIVEVPRGDVEAEQALLAAATEAGLLREFSPVRPHLADLFRDAVTKDGVTK